MFCDFAVSLQGVTLHQRHWNEEIFLLVLSFAAALKRELHHLAMRIERREALVVAQVMGKIQRTAVERKKGQYQFLPVGY